MNATALPSLPTPSNPKKISKEYILIGGLAILILVLLGVIGIMLVNKDTKESDDKKATTKDSLNENQDTVTTLPMEGTNNSEPEVSRVNWSFNGTNWISLDTAPSCPEPLNLTSPTDLTTATNILYPGQVRGGDFKPHGGARYDNNANNNVTVTLPMDAVLWRGSRYIESGEVQYMLDFIAPCGIMFRFDHLLTLSTDFQTVVEAQLPEAKPDDSRTYNFDPQTLYKKGTVIASAIGHTQPAKNVSYDWGVYDLRSANEASKNATFKSTHASEAETAFFATCWLDLLTPTQSSIAKALPGAGVEGKTSEYCK